MTICPVFPAIANFLGLVSCDLLKYDIPGGVGGTVGLFRYGLNDSNECLAFTEETAEDSTFGPARAGAIAAFTLAICLLALNFIHYSVWAIPQKDVLFYTIGACMQLCLALVQLLWRNELCDTYGCYMGDGSSWTGLAHIMYMAATCISLFIEEPQHGKALQQQPYTITTPFARQLSSRKILDLR